MKFGLVSGTKDRFTLGAFFFSGLPNLFVHLNFQREKGLKERHSKSWQPVIRIPAFHVLGRSRHQI